MHRSRLASLVIDFEEGSFEEGAAFWSAALGRERIVKSERFESLRGRIGGEGGVYVGFQRGKDDPQRFHIDIEADDVEAEIARLERLGARVKKRIRSHCIMRAPGGHTFCVIPSIRGDFPATAKRWP